MDIKRKAKASLISRNGRTDNLGLFQKSRKTNGTGNGVRIRSSLRKGR